MLNQTSGGLVVAGTAQRSNKFINYPQWWPADSWANTRSWDWKPVYKTKPWLDNWIISTGYSILPKEQRGGNLGGNLPKFAKLTLISTLLPLYFLSFGRLSLPRHWYGRRSLPGKDKDFLKEYTVVQSSSTFTQYTLNPRPPALSPSSTDSKQWRRPGLELWDANIDCQSLGEIIRTLLQAILFVCLVCNFQLSTSWKWWNNPKTEWETRAHIYQWQTSRQNIELHSYLKEKE